MNTIFIAQYVGKMKSIADSFNLNIEEALAK